MAEAVIFAMIWSFILSRTLVPTMAMYLLRKHAPHRQHGPTARCRPRAIRWSGSSAASRRGSNARGRLSRSADAGARHRAIFVTAFLALFSASFALVPYLGRDFFPSVDGGQILMHVRTPVGTRVEENARHFADIEKVVRQIIPPDELETIVDNIGMPISGINMTYNNTGTIGRRTATSRSAERKSPSRPRTYVAGAARGAAGALPRARLSRSCRPTSSARS